METNTSRQNTDKSITTPLFNQKTESYDKVKGRYKIAIYLKEGKGLQVAKIYEVIRGEDLAPHYKVSGVLDYSSIDLITKGDNAVVVGMDFFNNETPPESIDQVNINKLNGLVRIIKENYPKIRDSLPSEIVSPTIYGLTKTSSTRLH